MAQIMKVFMDMSIDYPELKIIAIGAVNSARKVVEFDPEMSNRISEIHVPLMNEEGLRDILEKGEDVLNVEFPEIVKNKIVAYSSGLPSITHQLAYLVCESENIFNTYTHDYKTNSSFKNYKIKPTALDKAIDEYIQENSDTLKSVYEHATRDIHKRKYEKPEYILKVITKIKKENISINDIKDAIELDYKGYRSNNLKKYVDEFTLPHRSEILRYNDENMTYYFSSPFVKAYCLCMLREDVKKKKITRSKLLLEFKSTLDVELNLAQEAFIRDLESEHYLD